LGTTTEWRALGASLGGLRRLALGWYWYLNEGELVGVLMDMGFPESRLPFWRRWGSSLSSGIWLGTVAPWVAGDSNLLLAGSGGWVSA